MKLADRPYRDLNFMSTVLGELRTPLAELSEAYRAELRQLLRLGLRAHAGLGEASPLLKEPELLNQAISVRDALHLMGSDDIVAETRPFIRLREEGISASL